jgi:hypothetical protein
MSFANFSLGTTRTQSLNVQANITSRSSARTTLPRTWVGLEIVFSVSEDQGSRKEIVMKIRARRWRDGSLVVPLAAAHARKTPESIESLVLMVN